jgi:hypothetical protein
MQVVFIRWKFDEWLRLQSRYDTKKFNQSLGKLDLKLTEHRVFLRRYGHRLANPEFVVASSSQLCTSLTQLC